MTALSSVAVTNRSPKGATITFNAAAIDCNGLQIKELKAVFDKLATECAGEMSSDTGVVATGI